MSAREKRRSFFQILRDFWKKNERRADQPLHVFDTGKPWLDLNFHKNQEIVKLDEVEHKIDDPPGPIKAEILDRIQGSFIGLALGDALGAHVEFRPREYLVDHPVDDLEEGGTWGLRKGQFTDDTSMALCLASSLVARRGFVPYDQLVRYKWWYKHGYMSSTGACFDIGTATKDSLDEFIRRQIKFGRKQRIRENQLDYLSDRHLIELFPIYCSRSGVAGNGALMRLAPVPLFFHEHIKEAIEYSGLSGYVTHGDRKAYDACRYFGALIVAALNGRSKNELLDKQFYEKYADNFGKEPLCDEIRAIVEGSYQKKGGYNDGIRGKGYIVYALEAALWAFWSDEDSFEKGVLAVVNLGDDTDTTAAIYGQLAGAFYGYKKLPRKWVDQMYAKEYLLKISKWLAYEGQNWKRTEVIIPMNELPPIEARAYSVDNLLTINPMISPRPRLRERSSSERAAPKQTSENPKPMTTARHVPPLPPSDQNPTDKPHSKMDNDRKSASLLFLTPNSKRKHQRPKT